MNSVHIYEKEIMVKSADRVCSILELVASNQRGLKHSEIAKSLNIPSSSLSALLNSLISRQYLFFDLFNKRYTLDSQILALAGQYLAGLDIVEISRPIVRNLSGTTGESAAVAIRKGPDIMIICREDSPQVIRRTIQVGERFPLYATASGKVILANLPEHEMEQYLSEVKLSPITQGTIKDIKALRNEIEKTRLSGYAFNRGESADGMVACAAPVFDMHGKVVATVSVSLPTSRFTTEREESLAHLIKEASIDLSRKLGFQS